MKKTKKKMLIVLLALVAVCASVLCTGCAFDDRGHPSSGGSSASASAGEDFEDDGSGEEDGSGEDDKPSIDLPGIPFTA